MGSVEQETQVQLEVANRAFDVRQRQPTHQVKDTCLLLVVHQLTSCLLDCRLFSLGASSVRSARVYVRARESRRPWVPPLFVGAVALGCVAGVCRRDLDPRL